MTPSQESLKVALALDYELDCEQSLFFFRFSKGSARARERWAARPRDARKEDAAREEKERLLA